MWCTSGYAPTAIDVRQTGVNDGNAVTARRYSPASASSDSVGAERSPTAVSNIDGVNPSMTLRTTVFGKRPEAGVLLAAAPAGAERKRRNRNRFQEADDGDQRECEHDHRATGEEHGRSRGSAAASHAAACEGAGTETAQRAAEGTCDARLPIEDEPADERAGDEPGQSRAERRSIPAAQQAGGENAERRSGTRQDADVPDLAHAR